MIKNLFIFIVGIILGAVLGGWLYLEGAVNEPKYKCKEIGNVANNLTIQNKTIDKFTEQSTYQEFLHFWFTFINKLHGEKNN
ncbi:hypothetical protein [Candidatus Phytoplasma fraxini]|uniref:Uncharacterized protein n=1 Tax=Ash yellows phytoplasma TaxID=35780 RepID=A0ABZ2UA07_ASHYP